MNRVRTVTALAATLLVAAAAYAHDFWISPSKFRIARDENVDIGLRVGMVYAGDAVQRDELRTAKFVVLGPDGVRNVPGENGKDPAGHVAMDKDGVYVVAFRSKGRSIDFDDPKRFEAYLREEGLEHVVELRAQRKETDRPGHEFYSRCAKALLWVGDGAKEGHDRVAGLRLEIVPETNPYLVADGAELSFRVAFEEKPLEHGLVVARSRAEPKHTVTARTDAAGRVKLVLDRPGEWLVKCVHMVEAPKETGMDWESLWASVTFDLAAKPR